MNRAFAPIVLAGLLGAGGAWAQDVTTSASPNPPAISSGHADSKTSAAPLAGKNSFTKSQVRDRLRAHRYSNVKGLMKDDQGVWRGKAFNEMSGKFVGVAVDYQGDITEQ
jgi:hypothetical protein